MESTQYKGVRGAKNFRRQNGFLAGSWSVFLSASKRWGACQAVQVLEVFAVWGDSSSLVRSFRFGRILRCWQFSRLGGFFGDGEGVKILFCERSSEFLISGCSGRSGLEEGVKILDVVIQLYLPKQICEWLELLEICVTWNSEYCLCVQKSIVGQTCKVTTKKLCMQTK